MVDVVREMMEMLTRLQELLREQESRLCALKARLFDGGWSEGGSSEVIDVDADEDADEVTADEDDLDEWMEWVVDDSPAPAGKKRKYAEA